MKTTAITINTIQANTKQVQAGYCTVTLAGTNKTVCNVVKLKSGMYGTTLDMNEHKTFMGALAAILPMYKAASAQSAVAVSPFIRAIKAVAAVMVIAPVFAHASNVDVNKFLSMAKVNTADAAGIYNGLNARDRMVVDGIADQAGISKELAAVKSFRVMDAAQVPAGWDQYKTLDFLHEAHQNAYRLAHPVTLAAAAPVTTQPTQAELKARFEAIKAQNLKDTIEKRRDNVARVSTQTADPVIAEIEHRAVDQDARDNGQDLAISDAHATATQAMNKALSAQGYAETVHDQVMVLGQDVDTNTAGVAANKAKNDTQDQEISGLAVQGNTNAQNIADETQARKDTDTAIITQMNNDHDAQTTRDAGQDSDIKTAQTVAQNAQNTADQKLDKAAYSHDHLLQTVKDSDQDAATQNAQAVADAAKTLADDQNMRDQYANQSRYTAMNAAHNQAVADNAPKAKDGKDGVNGADGKDGVTTTITKVETDTQTRSQVANNTASIRGVRSEQAAQGEFIQQQAAVVSQHSAQIRDNSQRIDQNSQRIDKNSRDIEDTKKDLKRGLNNAAAMTGLHYHSNDSYAISAGTSNGDGAALAGGLSHSITEHTAATVQASTSMDGGWMASVGFSGDF